MQTFLPYASLVDSVNCLDNKRLGKQRVEALQIINVLEGRSKGWANHPAVKMWVGYTEALHLYKDLCITEWIDRGFKNTMPFTYYGQFDWVDCEDTEEPSKIMPPWFGGLIHRTHRSNLLRKDPVYYGQFNWTEAHDRPYFWPKIEDYATNKPGLYNVYNSTEEIKHDRRTI